MASLRIVKLFTAPSGQDFDNLQNPKVATFTARTVRKTQGIQGADIEAARSTQSSKKVDIVLVLDTSRSMFRHIQEAAEHLGDLISSFPDDASWQVRLVPSDPPEAPHKEYPPVKITIGDKTGVEFKACGAGDFIFKGVGKNSDAVVQEKARFNAMLQSIATSVQSRAQNNRKTNFIEAIIYNANLALTCDLFSSKTEGPDFWLRPDSHVHVIFVSEQNNCEPNTTRPRCADVFSHAGITPKPNFVNVVKAHIPGFKSQLEPVGLTMLLSSSLPLSKKGTAIQRLFNQNSDDHELHARVSGILSSEPINNTAYMGFNNDGIIPSSGGTLQSIADTENFALAFQNISQTVKLFVPTSFFLKNFTITTRGSPFYGMEIGNSSLPPPDPGSLVITPSTVKTSSDLSTFYLPDNFIGDVTVKYHYGTRDYEANLAIPLDMDTPILESLQMSVGDKLWELNSDYHFDPAGKKIICDKPVPDSKEALVEYFPEITIEKDTFIQEIAIDDIPLAQNNYSIKDTKILFAKGYAPKIGQTVTVAYTNTPSNIYKFNAKNPVFSVAITDWDRTKCAEIEPTIKDETISITCKSDPSGVVQVEGRLTYKALDQGVELSQEEARLFEGQNFECGFPDLPLEANVDWSVSNGKLVVSHQIIQKLTADTNLICEATGKR